MQIETVFLPSHLLALLFCFITIIRSDLLGFKWLRGKIDTIEGSKLNSLHTQIWCGLSVMILTGIALFWPNRDSLLSSEAFYVKMSAVVALIINGLIIGRLMKVATIKPFKNLDKLAKSKLYISGAISTLAWATAIIAAFFILGGNQENILSKVILPASSSASTTVLYTLSEISKYNTEKDCFTTINSKVYYITKYIPYHPGGKSNIMKVCGVDGTNVFMGKHSGDTKPNMILSSMQVGVVEK